MKHLKLVLTIFVCTLLYNNTFAQGNYVSKIAKYRDSIDAVFADSSGSILLKEDRVDFKGLDYFKIDEKWLVKAKFRRSHFSKAFEMQTSTKRLPVYKKYGKLIFHVGKQKVKLTVYQNVSLSESEEYKDYLFCPFRDKTAPAESYGGGRYLDLKKSALTKRCSVDFNLSYNPYCAYNYRYSCPIPPAENHLKVRIEAGIKKWH
jgi:uncharacterized protein